MKILFYRYGSICEPDIIDGFCELGNEVVTITEEIYNKKLLPSEGVALLNEALQKASYDFVFSINFYPFISEVCNIFRFAISAGPWTVRSWNFIPIPSAIRGIGFFSLTARSITNFPATTLPAFFICRWQAIQRAGKK